MKQFFTQFHSHFIVPNFFVCISLLIPKKVRISIDYNSLEWSQKQHQSWQLKNKYCNNNLTGKKCRQSNEHSHFLPITPELERRRSARLELFKTDEDLGTDIFLSFKNSKALFEHWGGPILLRITGSKLQITVGTHNKYKTKCDMNAK